MHLQPVAAYVPRRIDEARSSMLARYARPIMGYDWTCTLLEVVRTLLTIAPYDSMTRMGEGATHDTA